MSCVDNSLPLIPLFVALSHHNRPGMTLYHVPFAQCPGLLLPSAPLDPESGYSCDQCGHEEAWDKVDTDIY